MSSWSQAKSLLPKAKPGESYQARIAPNHLNVLLNLANLIAKNQTRLEEADMLYRQAISMRSDYTQAYINRGDVLLKLNRTKEAQEVYERALFYDTDNPDIYYNVSVKTPVRRRGISRRNIFTNHVPGRRNHTRGIGSEIIVRETAFPWPEPLVPLSVVVFPVSG